MIAPFLDDYVGLRSSDHKYFDKDGKEYESVSGFRARFKKPFDPGIAYSCAGRGDYVGMSGEDVLKKWKAYGEERGGIGTKIHDACERYERSGVVLGDDEGYRAGILSICGEYKDYYKIYQEQVLYDEEHMIAGTADKLLVLSSHRDSVIDITDYKTNLKGVNVRDLKKDGKPKNEYFTGPLSHLLLSKYSDYALQLSIYAYLLSKKTGRRIGSLRIHYIDPENLLNHYFIPVVYMRYEVEAMLRWRRDNILVGGGVMDLSLDF